MRSTLAASIACSGPSTMHERPPARSAASVSAARGAPSSNIRSSRSTAAPSSSDHVIDGRRTTRAVLDLREEIGRDQHRRDRRRRRRPRPPTDRRSRRCPTSAATWRFASATYALPGPDDHVDRVDRLGPVRERGDRLRAADPVDDVDLGEPRRGEDRVVHGPVGRGAACRARRAARRRRVPAAPSSAPTTRAAPGPRARSSRPGRPARAARESARRSARARATHRTAPRARPRSGRGRARARPAARDRDGRARPPPRRAAPRDRSSRHPSKRSVQSRSAASPPRADLGDDRRDRGAHVVARDRGSRERARARRENRGDRHEPAWGAAHRTGRPLASGPRIRRRVTCCVR